jgi:hypothetical protein
VSLVPAYFSTLIIVQGDCLIGSEAGSLRASPEESLMGSVAGSLGNSLVGNLIT